MYEENTKLLAYFYQNIHPTAQLYKYLGINEFREISFTLKNGSYLRYVTFDSLKTFEEELKAEVPVKIDIGAVYNQKPQIGRELIPFQK